MLSLKSLISASNLAFLSALASVVVSSFSGFLVSSFSGFEVLISSVFCCDTLAGSSFFAAVDS